MGQSISVIKVESHVPMTIARPREEHGRRSHRMLNFHSVQVELDSWNVL